MLRVEYSSHGSSCAVRGRAFCGDLQRHRRLGSSHCASKSSVRRNTRSRSTVAQSTSSRKYSIKSIGLQTDFLVQSRAWRFVSMLTGTRCWPSASTNMWNSGRVQEVRILCNLEHKPLTLICYPSRKYLEKGGMHGGGGFRRPCGERLFRVRRTSPDIIWHQRLIVSTSYL